jgi:predicted PurR-regulated permease PerM
LSAEITPQTIGVIVAVCGFLLAMMVHIAMVARAWGSFRTIIDQLSKSLAKMEELVEKLFDRSEGHGDRIARLEEAQRHTTSKGMRN